MEKIGEIEMKLREEKIYLNALQDTLKLAPGSNGNANGNAELRTGSLVALAREILRKAGKPMHVREILKDMAKEATRNNRVSLSGSRGGYIRRNQIFTNQNKKSMNTLDVKLKIALKLFGKVEGLTAEQIRIIHEVYEDYY